jgi:DNA-binding GntR family transcriptional regulator
MFAWQRDRPCGVAKWQHLADDLTHAITTGLLSPGCRIPPEHALETAFGYSRSTVRTAIRQVRYLGLVDVRHPQGTFVVDAAQLPPALNAHHITPTRIGTR